MRLPVRSLLVVLAAACASLATALPAAASTGQTGFLEPYTSDPVTAAPPPSRPDTAHCSVTLADKFASNAPDRSPQSYTGTLTPPTACPGPWAKVLLTQSITVSGRQYDRVGTVTLGGVQVYRGTTEEPSGPHPTHYTVTSDLTDFTALLRTAQPFTGGIGNYQDDTYTGNYVQTVRVTYYQADARHPAPRTADKIVGLGDNALSPSTPTAEQQVTDLPRNITNAYLRTTLEGAGCDEQWFSAVPDEVSARYPSAGLCAHGPYREADISLDGHPVAATHTFPHIYSGGIVPTLWRPIPAIGTFDLHPETVDVTPFVGLLVDGGTHRFGFGLQDINDNWDVVANLFLFTDHNAERTTGALTTDDVAATASVHTDVTDVDGGSRAVVSAARHDTTEGWVQTSAGRVDTVVTRTTDFRNDDTITAQGLTQAIRQSDHGSQTSVSRVGGRIVAGTRHGYDYPLAVDYSAAQYVDDQNFSLTGHVDMTRTVHDQAFADRSWTPTQRSTENVDTDGVLSRTDGQTSQSDGRSTSTYVGFDDQGRPYRHYLASRHGILISNVVHRG